MTGDRRRDADKTPSAPDRTREDRLGAALRANLQRRKARARALDGGGGTDQAAGDAGRPRGTAAED